MIDHADKSWLRRQRNEYPGAFDVIGTILAITSILAAGVLGMFL